MATAADHYDHHLGAVYSWMVGNIDAALARGDAELDALGLEQSGTGSAVDLGAGIGLHALPLARRGFSVIAVDTCDALLKELASRAGALPIRSVRADLLHFRKHIDAPVDVILCMGDTLTHLPDTESVKRLIAEIAASLVNGGIFMSTFRDYVTRELRQEERFIPVRSDPGRILTCFLEYAESAVTVHDLLYELIDGDWQLRVSSYSKLRLSPEWLMDALSAHGFSARCETLPTGMTRVISRRISR